MDSTTTYTSRYPSTLSHSASGPSRPPRTNRYEPETPLSIDEEVPSPPAPSTHEYSSLAEMLQKAGYKETRVFTPEAEKARSRIKKTFDEEDNDEIESLYGVYGFQPRKPSGLAKSSQNNRNGHEHRIQHVTEPTIPIKSSSSILRSLALQDVTALNNDRIRASSPSSNESWWGLAALGLAKKGNPEKVIIVESTSPVAYSTPRQASSGVGLGLASGGQGVRKVKSTWELERETRRPQQEDRPPLPRKYSSPESDTPTRFSGFGISTMLNQNPPSNIASLFNPPPPPALDDDGYGYCPLPDDYEAQDDEDEALYGMSFSTDVFSLGSDSSGSRSGSEERDIANVHGGLDDMLSGSRQGSGSGFQNLLKDAVEYSDNEDSPVKKTWALPVFDVRPQPIRTSTSPEPESHPMEETPKKPIPKQTKYGDRATKLRIAKSTPHLATTSTMAKPSWLGSLRTAFLGNAHPAGYQAIPTLPEPAQKRRLPFRVSPVVPAMPTLVTASPVICDSTSTEAEDLPPIQSPTLSSQPTITSVTMGAVSSIALRLRPSIQTLRGVVGMSEKPKEPVEDGTSPMLSPRLDWGAQGEQFAGWGWSESAVKTRPPLPWTSTVDSISDTDKETSNDPLPDQDNANLEIDYSKSFFYKPPTPPRTRESSDQSSDSATSSSSSTVTSADSQKPVARRQRSIKSLRAALLIPVAPVPPLPNSHLHPSSAGLRTPPTSSSDALVPPVLAITSPGAWEAGLPPRELVLEGEEWDAREGGVPGDWGTRRKSKTRSKSRGRGKSVKKRLSKEEVV